MKRENLSSLGTVVASFLAASCCIGPAVFVAFGASVGFLGKLTFFETYRPYLLGAGFLMLGFSFWKLFIKKPDCPCEEDIRSRKIARGIWWFGFGSLVLAASWKKVWQLSVASVHLTPSWGYMKMGDEILEEL